MEAAQKVVRQGRNRWMVLGLAWRFSPRQPIPCQFALKIQAFKSRFGRTSATHDFCLVPFGRAAKVADFTLTLRRQERNALVFQRRPLDTVAPDP